MRKRCLPCQTIVRNVVVVLLTCAGLSLVFAETHAAFMGESQQGKALRRVFLYQIVTQIQQEK
jgi:hypothetical protein